MFGWCISLFVHDCNKEAASKLKFYLFPDENIVITPPNVTHFYAEQFL